MWESQHTKVSQAKITKSWSKSVVLFVDPKCYFRYKVIQSLLKSKCPTNKIQILQWCYKPYIIQVFYFQMIFQSPYISPNVLISYFSTISDSILLLAHVNEFHMINYPITFLNCEYNIRPSNPMFPLWPPAKFVLNSPRQT